MATPGRCAAGVSQLSASASASSSRWRFSRSWNSGSFLHPRSSSTHAVIFSGGEYGETGGSNSVYIIPPFVSTTSRRCTAGSRNRRSARTGDDGTRGPAWNRSAVLWQSDHPSSAGSTLFHDSYQWSTGPMGEHHAPPLRIATPDAAFRISREERGRLRDGIDADALERFLGMVHPSYRSRILDTFMAREGRDGVTLFDRVPDPVLQRALDEVWAPRRQMITPELAARAEQNLRARSEPMEVLLVAAIPGSTADAVVV